MSCFFFILRPSTGRHILLATFAAERRVKNEFFHQSHYISVVYFVPTTTIRVYARRGDNRARKTTFVPYGRRLSSRTRSGAAMGGEGIKKIKKKKKPPRENKRTRTHLLCTIMCCVRSRADALYRGDDVGLCWATGVIVTTAATCPTVCKCTMGDWCGTTTVRPRRRFVWMCLDRRGGPRLVACRAPRRKTAGRRTDAAAAAVAADLLRRR